MRSKILSVKNGEITMTVPKNRANSLFQMIGEECDVDIKKTANSRSLDANAYLWVLCGKIAEVIGSTKWDVYKHELKKWSGVFTYMVVEPKMAQVLKSRENETHTDFRCIEILNEGEFNGKKAVQILAYLGSHLFDSREMSVLLDGVVEDCKELEIETMPPDEIERLEKLWQGNK